MKSLKSIVSENQTSFASETYENDIRIVLDFLKQNFSAQTLDYMLLLLKNYTNSLEFTINTLQKHQSENITTYSNSIIKKLDNDMDNYGEIQTKNWAMFIQLCKMYMDSNVKFEMVNPVFKIILDREKDKIVDLSIIKWIGGTQND